MLQASGGKIPGSLLGLSYISTLGVGAPPLEPYEVGALASYLVFAGVHESEPTDVLVLFAWSRKVII